MAYSVGDSLIIEYPCQDFNDIYQHDLQMYNDPPLGKIILPELQQLCIERFKVLQLVERVALKNYRMPSKQCRMILIQKLMENNLSDFAKLINAPGCRSHTEMDLRLRRKDHISHFILRSAFAFEYEKKRWFYRQEVRLFKWRFSSLDADGVKQFKYINGFHYEPIPCKEVQEVKSYLEMSSISIDSIDDIPFYKVAFVDVLDLISKRSIFINEGIAFVPETKISSLFVTHFKRNLSAGFEYAREISAKVSADGRLTNIFKKLSSAVKIRNSQFEIFGQTSINELDKLSETSYPLCMKTLHDALRSKHHLTNGGRVQYSLFLKGIGVRLDEVLQLWEREFTQKMDEATFQKEYRYQIRHLYGKEGKRANYTPFSCAKIMRSKVGTRDNHGCPFKHMAPNVLAEKLSACDLLRSDVKTILQLSEAGQYLEACRKYYESTHSCITRKLFEHPNQYFNESRKRYADNSSADDSIYLPSDVT